MVNVVLHCSASSFGNAALIAKWHSLPAEPVVQNGREYHGRGWQGIGYHYVILNGWVAQATYHPLFDGHIETGRPLDNDPVLTGNEAGAHVRGYNVNSVGVCLIGNSGQFTQAQLNAALKVVYLLERQFTEINIVQHSDLDPNKPECAGLDMDRFKRNYLIYKRVMEQRPSAEYPPLAPSDL